MGFGLGSAALLDFSLACFWYRNAEKNMLMKSHSALCFLSLPRQESWQVLHSATLADFGSLVWNCISTTLLCFDLLLLSYVVHLILNLPRLISPG
ncbi:hypothetical protein V6N12_031054 [Hibiscus sabdariffa]|uniref:Uncharacterized protein n=1 Tax=Hibiscus sabdariffa TaxID=183260 RepID=A0ABR2E7U1_9ROSI